MTKYNWKIEKEKLGLCTRAKGCKNKTENGNKTCQHHIQMAFQNNLKNGNKNKIKSREWRENNPGVNYANVATWRKNNPEKRKKQEQRRYLKHKEKILQQSKEYYLKNRRNVLNRIKDQRKKNPKKFVDAARIALRRAKKKNAVPNWADKEELKQIYKNCPNDYHVDHIIPLTHKKVCGLHVPWNLQYLHSIHNDNKGNSFDGTADNTKWKLKRTLIRYSSENFLKSEFKNINKKEPKYEHFTAHNRITTYFNPHFYDKENLLWTDKDVREKIYKNREKYINKKPLELTDLEILRGFKISGTHVGFSHHSPFWIKKFIEDYDVTSVYDPCGGWGHRLLGCSNIKYIYNDLDSRSCDGTKNIIKYFKLQNKTVYNNDAANFTPPEDYQCVFTCPPYFNTEMYEIDKFKEQISDGLDSWLENFWRKLIQKSIKPGVRWFCFIINHKYKDDLAKICIEENLELVEKHEVGRKKIKSHLCKGTNKNEFLIIFSVNN